MFRIMLLLCYSLIDTNTIPFYFSLFQIGIAVILPQHGAFVDSKGLGNLLRINHVSLTSLHTLRGAFAEIDPPAVLSSIRIPTLDRV